MIDWREIFWPRDLGGIVKRIALYGALGLIAAGAWLVAWWLE
jgi:hypothetical protein